jgi:hypothetical protein
MRRLFPSFLACVAVFLMLASGAARAAADADAALTEFKKAVKEENQDKIKETAAKLSATGEVKYAKEIFTIAVRKADMSVDAFNLVLAALAAFDNEACIKYYQDEVQGKEPNSRVLAVDIAGAMTGDKGISIILTGLKDGAINVIESALNATIKRRPKDAVPVLIDLVDEWTKKKTKDAVFYNIRQTLVELTGENIDQPEDWRKWWEASKVAFDPKKVKETGKRSTRRIGGDEDPQFFGVPISSKNAVFVIDISQSMMYVQKDDIPGLSTADGTDKGGGMKQAKEKLTTENERLAKYWTRIEMAKRNLIKVLKGLKSPTKFNIVAFNDKVLKFTKSSQGVVAATQKKGTEWVQGLRINGNTATLQAIKDAFTSDSGVNTIYFLSDGLPSKDGVNIDNLDDLLKEIEKLNRFRKIKIHTFGFDPKTMAGMTNPDLQRANDFLAKLAQSTGGTFTLMKVDPNEKPPKDFK